MPALLSKQQLRTIWGKTGFQHLEQREKIFLGAGVAFLLIIFLVQFVVFPCLDARRRLTRSLAEKRLSSVKIVGMQKEFRLLQGTSGMTKERLSVRPPGFTLFSFLEEQAAKAKVKQQIQYMKPSTTDKDGVEQESIVEIKLQRIPLCRLVAFLELVESSKNMVSIRHISIQESGADDTLLDVVLQVFTFADKT